MGSSSLINGVGASANDAVGLTRRSFVVGGALAVIGASCTTSSGRPSPTTSTNVSLAMIGDSITQGSRQALEFAMAAGGYPAPVIDADDGRRIATGDDPLRGTQVLSNLMAMDIRPTVWVIALGTNDAGSYQDRAAYAALVDEMLILLPPASPVVWIDVYRPDVGEHVTMFNDALAERVGARPASAIGSWFAIASAKEQQVLRGDRVHPNVDGQRAFAELVMSTVSRL